MGNLRDGGGVGKRRGLGEERGGFFTGVGNIEYKSVVVVSTYPAEDVGPVWLCMLLLLVSTQLYTCDSSIGACVVFTQTLQILPDRPKTPSVY